MSFNCLECDQEFDSEKSLHAHIKKHKIFIHDYFVKHFARRNLLTNELLPFKDKESYFSRDFFNIQQLYQWCDVASEETARNYTLEKLLHRIESKKLEVAPNEIELYTSFLPKIDIYKKLFKSYTYACEKIGYKPMFSGKIPKEYYEDYSESFILTDTREQQPLKFKNQKIQKLDVGDYAIIDGFDYTYVDRKSESDFKTTLSKDNFDRFRRELERCRKMNSYLFIVIEADLYRLEINNRKDYHKSNMSYIYHNMRVLQHEFRDCCQFLFTVTRRASEKLIPKILNLGKRIWNVDMQYHSNHELANWIAKKQEQEQRHQQTDSREGRVFG
jgi:hypothetical protein